LGVRPWQAAQFTVAHKWISIGEKGFQPAEPLNRGEAATLLDRAFALNGPPDDANAMYGKALYQKATYADVPLYSPISPSVEAWHASGSLPACKESPALFCPAAPITVGEFVDAVVALAARQTPARKLDAASLHRNIDDANDAPLTRISAALVLYSSID
jgi:hypothetical protein